MRDCGDGGQLDVAAIDFDEGPASPSRVHQGLVDANWTKCQTLMSGSGSLRARPVKMFSQDGRRIGGRSVAALYNSLSEFDGYSDVIVDISALPRGIYFPLIARILTIFDQPEESERKPAPDLHVFVAESPAIDRRIQDEGIDDVASYIHGFGGAVDAEATAEVPRVWFPVLGERQVEQLTRIHDLVQPDEIAPLLPWPSGDPRRADDLLLEYRETLLDRLSVEPTNFIYASERNPFEVYRQIRRAILHYLGALAPLGGCKAVLSAQSTKLLSVGALLVAYELRAAGLDVGVAHVECQGYRVESGGGQVAEPEVFGLWLSGTCYEP
jgi:hypothetical protein